MERLTEDNFSLGFDDSNKLPSYESIYERLRYYEKMEEQGKMMILPCKPGDTVYFLENVNYTKKIGVNEVVTARVIGICSSSNEEGEKIWCMRLFTLHGEYLIPFDKFGKIVFSTEPEAEKALEGMKNE